MPVSRLLDAKRALYKEILSVPHKQLSGEEVEIGYLLSKDKSIQKILQGRLNEEKKESERDGGTKSITPVN